MNIDLQDFKLCILPGENPSPRVQVYYASAFDHWYSNWQNTMRELEGHQTLFSDNFTRQHEIFALFKDLQCVAMICHRLVDMSLPTHRLDSYFQPWPTEAIGRLNQHGHRVLIGSQISVSPEYRGRLTGKFAGHSLKDLITSVSMLHLHQLPIDAITGTMRADKGMHSLVYNLGAENITSNVLFHNVPVDLIAFYPQVKKLNLAAETLSHCQGLLQGAVGTSPLKDLLHTENKKHVAS